MLDPSLYVVGNIDWQISIANYSYNQDSEVVAFAY